MSERVNVDTAALAQGQSSARDTIDAVREAAEFMINKLHAANDRFASRNYDRISESMRVCASSFESIYSMLDGAVNYLKLLEEHIEEYSKNKY